MSALAVAAPPEATVAALYVQADGCYAGIEGVDAWPEERDARAYAGPHPVVAHPPCARWCALAALVESLGGEPVGADGGTFAAALAAVRSYGGVLEHPAYSRAWAAHGLARPTDAMGWTGSLLDGGWTCVVSQAAYGHRARKLTWLYAVVPDPPPMLWERPEPETQVSDVQRHRRHPGRRMYGAEASATPPAFRDALLAIARAA